MITWTKEMELIKIKLHGMWGNVLEIAEGFAVHKVKITVGLAAATS